MAGRKEKEMDRVKNSWRSGCKVSSDSIYGGIITGSELSVSLSIWPVREGTG